METKTEENIENGAIALIVEHNPAVVLTNPEKRDALYSHIEKEVEEKTFDLSTAAGRDECKAFAYKITKTKTAVEQAGKDLTEEARKKIAVITAERKAIVDKLAELSKRARQPLTDWETAEEKRIEECENALKALTGAGVVAFEATSVQIKALIDELAAFEIDPDKFKGMTEAAIKAKNHSMSLLESALARAEKAEADARELAELRKLKEEADAREEQRRAEEEAERKRKAEEEAAEAKRIADEKAAEEKRQREEQEKREIEEKEKAERAAAEERAAEKAREDAKREAEAKAQAEQEERDRIHAAELKAEQDRIAELEREAEEERKRKAKEKADAEAEAERIRKLEADKAHRTRVKTEAKEAIMTCGVDEATAQKIVLLIIAGEVPRVRLDFAAEPAVKIPALEPTLV